MEDGVRVVHGEDAQREIAVEIGFPRVVVNDCRHAREQVLPRPREQGFPAWPPPPFRDSPAIAALDVLGPVAGIAIGRLAEPSVMVAVQMVVRIDQPRPHVGVGGVDDDVVMPAGLDDLAVGDGDGPVAGVEQAAHLRRPCGS